MNVFVKDNALLYKKQVITLVRGRLLWHDEANQETRFNNLSQNWVKAPFLPIPVEDGPETSKFVSTPHCHPLWNQIRLANVLLTTQSSPQMRHRVSPTSSSTRSAAASTQSKTQHVSCFTEQKKRGHLPLLGISFKCLGRVLVYAFHLYWKWFVSIKNGWLLKWLSSVEKQCFQPSMSYFLTGLCIQKNSLKMAQVFRLFSKVNATPVITQSPLNNFSTCCQLPLSLTVTERRGFRYN